MFLHRGLIKLADAQIKKNTFILKSNDSDAVKSWINFLYIFFKQKSISFLIFGRGDFFFWILPVMEREQEPDSLIVKWCLLRTFHWPVAFFFKHRERTSILTSRHIFGVPCLTSKTLVRSKHVHRLQPQFFF